MIHQFRVNEFLFKSKCFILIITLFVCCNSQNNPIQNENIVDVQQQNNDTIDKKYYYDKIKILIDEYNYRELIKYDNRENIYPIEDSLCFYMKKLDKRELIKDEYFMFLMGKLLEKLYLEARKETTKPETFPIYNASILYNGDKSNLFALNITLQNKMGIDLEFDKYATIWTDFVCIDSVILTLDKLPQMQTDSIHRICKDLVDRDKTGGCMW